ncbi:ArsR/SmtB family transcription factor [Anaerosporobacter sp.]|uniref:ArsR/SmtB family transcription factor n=1 Tax=Anaerosporobacter sp. TaxID=1872529 RepID=UPI00286F0CEA|nr:metalloregulator ArsR/SmtB family transcription factor [Anaerosporobacter sp.]
MEKECQKRIEEITSGFKECQNAFTAIGDQTRQLILLVLLQSDLSGIRVGEIAEKTHLTRPSVSHHLQILKEAGIVNMREEGTKNYYYISADESRWKKIVDLINLVYEGVLHIK